MIDGKTLRDAIISGANHIEAHAAEVDELNVFPVPDGDTGTNMSMTSAAAREELLALPDGCTVAEAAETAAGAMLRGARGNSGVITSLLFRGFARALADKKRAGSQDICAAFEKGVSSAYKAVMKPTEGTMLTVARVVAEALAEEKDENETEAQQWQRIVEVAAAALAKTPEQLPILKKAGVVDSGGQGLLYILEGMRAVIAGGQILAAPAGESKPKAKLSTVNVGKGVFAHELNPDITNAYCTEFLVNRENGADPLKLRAFLESNGDSVVVVDDEKLIKCHVHTAQPGRVLSEALKFGYLTKLKIENMHEQYEQRKAQGQGLEKQAEAEKDATAQFPYAAADSQREAGFVAVAAGEGLREVFADLGVDAIVSGGQTMNPSTETILAAIHSVPAKNVFVLPNNKNIIMAAEQAVKLADRKVIVVPTRTVPQGMSAMLAYDAAATAEENVIAMNRMAEGVDTGLVTFASRNSDFDGKKIKRGEIIGLENGKLVQVGADITKVAQRLVRTMIKKDTSFITLISGSDVSEEDARRTAELIQAKLPANMELSLIAGGQPVYYYMIAVE